MFKRILHKFRIDEISAVDRPCQEGALAAIMKRAPSEFRKRAGMYRVGATVLESATAALAASIDATIAKRLPQDRLENEVAEFGKEFVAEVQKDCGLTFDGAAGIFETTVTECFTKAEMHLSTTEEHEEQARQDRAKARRARMAQAIQARHGRSKVHPDAKAILDRPLEEFMDMGEDDETVEKRLLKGRTMPQVTANGVNEMLTDYAKTQRKDGETVAKAYLRLVKTDDFAKSLLSTHQSLAAAERNNVSPIFKRAPAPGTVAAQDMNALASVIRKQEPKLTESQVLAKAYTAAKRARQSSAFEPLDAA